MSSTLQLGGATTAPISPVIDSSSNAKTPNHGMNLTSHLNSQHGVQNNTQEVALNPSSTVLSNAISPALVMCSPVKVNPENITNCTMEKISTDMSANTKPVLEVSEDKPIPASNAVTNNSPKVEVTNDVIEKKAPETLSPLKNNLNHTPVVAAPSTVKSPNEVVNSVTSTKENEDDQNTSPEAVCTTSKEDCESPKTSTPANNNVTSSTSSPPNVVSSSTTPSIPETSVAAQFPQSTISTTVQQPENRTPVKPANTMKLATVPTRTHIKRKRELKTNSSPKKNLTDDDEENEEGAAENEEQKSKRARVKTQPYQSPLPEIAIITKMSANMAKPKGAKASDDKLIIFYKNEFLAVRNSDGGFYVCQAMQNVYKSSPKIRIRWLSQNSEDASGETYSPDFYDITDFDCILTNLNLNRLDKGLYKLPAVELERTRSILQRALDVEQGVASPLHITEEHPDGLDLSLYRNEAQLDGKKGRKANKKKKVKMNAAAAEGKASKDPLIATSSKSKIIKKSNKKRKANPVQAAKSKIAKSKITAKKVVETTPVTKAVASSSKTRQIRAILVQPSTSKAKTTLISKKKVQDPSKTTTNSTAKTKGRSTTRSTATAAAVATTSRSSRGSKSMKETRRSTK